MTAPRVVVVGGGISGLAAAFTLVEEARLGGLELDLTVLEASAEAGGHVQTVSEHGFLVESGPNGFLDREPQTLALIASLGLTSRLVEAKPEAKRRFIVRGGRLRQVPDSPGTLLRTTALSSRSKLRLLLEPFAPAAPTGGDETVFEFASRRLGAEAAEMLVDAAVGGISAGDSRVLSVRAQFPLMVEMEREHGSLIRALRARRSRGLGPSRLLSFDSGLGTLTRAVAQRLGRNIRLGEPVRSIDRHGRGFRLALDGRAVEADHVLLAVSASAAAGLVVPLDPDLSKELKGIDYSGVAVVALAFAEADLPAPLAGYGYLATRGENLATLGVVWESSLFAGRAPDGSVLMRVFLGGARRPDILELDDEALLALALTELAHVMQIHAMPRRHWVFRWPKAIAQYTVGHLDRIRRIRERVAAQPGLDVCGASYDGVSLNQALASGVGAARSLANRLRSEALRENRTALPVMAPLARTQ